MATPESIAIRKAEANERAAKAARKLAKAAGVEAVDLAPAHKDPLMQGAIQAEALADFLESIAGGKATDESTPSVDPNSEIPGTVETIEGGLGEGVQVDGQGLAPVTGNPKKGKK